jgi:putative zinc finger/helix-turn-helix YgiT family protein
MNTSAEPTTTECAYCDGPCRLETYSSTLKQGRRSFAVTGLKKWVCTHCGGAHEDEYLSELNLNTLEAFTATQQGAVTPGMLRKLRRTWGLTQSVASKMFGAGANSFAKWESSQSRISTPAALLIQTAFHVPQAMVFLARMADIHLEAHQKSELLHVLTQAKKDESYQSIHFSENSDALKCFQSLGAVNNNAANDAQFPPGFFLQEGFNKRPEWHGVGHVSDQERMQA